MKNNYFESHEYECKCGCGLDTINPILLEKINHLREDLGAPVIISSGLRCEYHNKIVGGHPNSSHLRGDAVDLLFSGHDKNYMIYLCEKYFKAIGIADNFIHVDLRDDKVRRWYY